MTDEIYKSIKSDPLKKLYEAHQNQSKLQEHMTLRHMEGLLYAAKQQGYKGTGKADELEQFTKNKFQNNPDALMQYKKDIALHHAAMGYITFNGDHKGKLTEKDFETALKEVEKLYKSGKPGERQRFNTYMREHSLMDEPTLSQHVDQYGEDFVVSFAQRDIPQYAMGFARQEIAAYMADIKAEHLAELEQITGLKKNYSNQLATEGLGREHYLRALGELATKGKITDEFVRSLTGLYKGTGKGKVTNMNKSKNENNEKKKAA